MRLRRPSSTLMQYPQDFVDWRLANGSYCHVCPLNDRRKVGTDGPLTAPFIGIAEAPGEKEEQFGIGRGLKYGRPLVGKSGYFLKIDQLAKAGIAELEYEQGRDWPRVKALNIFLMNVVMCRPPQNKITSKEGKAAVACCSNSARALLRELLVRDPDRMLVPMGATANALLHGKTKMAIEPYRGRVEGPYTQALLDALADEPEMDIYKRVLRGRKPTEPWWPSQHYIIKRLLSAQRRGIVIAAKRPPAEAAPVLTIIKLLITKQRAALRKRAKEVV